MLFTSLICAALPFANVEAALPQQTSAFVNVTVVPMDRERLLKDQTVLIQNGRITEVGDARRVRVPSGATRIEGKGKFLLPGLIDMHTHLFSDDEFPDELAPDELMVMVANGVTTTRLMIGTPEHLKLRERIRKGEIQGPTLYVASPQLTGRQQSAQHNGRYVATAEDGKKAVQDFKAAGYDFIKLTYSVRQPAYDAIVLEGKALGIPIVGHVDPEVGAWHAVSSGQQIEHLDAYLEAILKDDSPIKDSVSSLGLFRQENWASLDHIDEAKLRALARHTADNKVYSTPTLTFFKVVFGYGATEEEVKEWPDYRFMPKKLTEQWFQVIPRLRARRASEARRMEYVRVRNELTKQIHLAGGKVMAGSDTPDAFLGYGFTLHRELKNLVDAGLTPFAALQAATTNPAEFLKATDNIGAIRKGMRADLVLLDANPLDKIENTALLAGVMSVDAGIREPS